MHFDGSPGDTAFLESRLLYPHRDSQCLQFYLYQSGASEDQLRVHIREFEEGDTTGTLRLIETLSGNAKFKNVGQSHYDWTAHLTTCVKLCIVISQILLIIRMNDETKGCILRPKIKKS